MRPNTEQIVVALLRALELIADGKTIGVSTTLPADATTWDAGFIVVQGVGGAPDIDLPVARPLVQLDFYVPSNNTDKPRWNQASYTAENVRSRLYHPSLQNFRVETPTGYHDALVSSIYPVSEPRRIPGDPSGHARFQMDVMLHWTDMEEEA